MLTLALLLIIMVTTAISSRRPREQDAGGPLVFMLKFSGGPAILLSEVYTSSLAFATICSNKVSLANLPYYPFQEAALLNHAGGEACFSWRPFFRDRKFTKTGVWPY